MSTPTPLTDGVIVLEELRPEDADPFVACEDDATRWAFGHDTPTTIEGARRVIEKAGWQWRRGSPWRRFAIRRVGSSDLIGWVLLRPRAVPLYLIEMNICPAYRDQRLGRRALGLACDFAFEVLAASAIEAETRMGHLASQRMAIAVGFEPTDDLRSTELGGYPISVGRLTRDRWRELRDA